MLETESQGFPLKLPRVPGRTTPAVGFSYLERSFKDCLRQRQFGASEKSKVVEVFEQWEPQPTCAYCGSTAASRWDHIVPVMREGATVLGNMVLACATCDDSKSQREFSEWMLGNTPKSPENRSVRDIPSRIARIRAYTELYSYRPDTEEDRLTSEERQRLRAIRDRLASVRQEVESLVDDFRERTGYR